jgi:hypothetical protein
MFTEKKLLGKHQEIYIGEFSTDRLGISTGSIQRQFYEDYDKPQWQYLSATQAPQNLVPIPCVGVTRSYNFAQGLAIYTYNYEGMMVPGIQDDVSTTFELDVVMNQDAIQSHPNWAVIRKKFKWNPDTEKFTETLPASSGGGTGLSGTQDSGKKVRNPLFGVESYFSIGATFRKNYARTFVPSDVLTGIGSIVGQPPDIGDFRIPYTGKLRNWLKMAPHIERRGNCVRITETWMLSGPGGWVQEIYGGGAIGDGSGPGAGPGGGLSSGGLQTGGL